MEDHQEEFRFYREPGDLGPRSSKGQGRIAVKKGHGDRGISPAKSKHKVRKRVQGEYESNELSVSAIQWSEKHYTVDQLVREFKDEFPLIVKVTQGYYGELEVEYCIGEVFQMQEIGRQARVEATDARGRRLSVPVDFPLEVTVDDNTRPRWIDQLHISMIPSVTELQFVVAQFMHGASHAEWSDFCGMFSRSVARLDFEDVVGCNDIIHLDQPMTRNTLPSTNAYMNVRPQSARPVTPTKSLPAGQHVRDKAHHRQGARHSDVSAPGGRHRNSAHATARTNPAYQKDDQEVSDLLNEVIELGEMSLSHEELRKPVPVPPSGGDRQNVYENIAPQPPPLEKRDRHASPPKAVVTPTVHEQVVRATVHGRTDTTPLPRHYLGAKSSSIETIDDVPSNIESLSVEDVGKCLALLSMTSHVDRFHRKQVDGAMLCSLNQNSLISDFLMTPFDANKLHRFTRGWRPKVT